MAGIEHMALGMALKPIAPKANVISLMVAAEILDLLCIPFYFLNPQSIALTHGLFMACFWSILFGLLAYLIYREKKTSLVFAFLILSHWVLDFITHPMTFIFPNQTTPDLPLLFDGSMKVGLGLYKTLPGIIISNIVLCGTAITIYIRYRLNHKRAA